MSFDSSRPGWGEGVWAELHRRVGAPPPLPGRCHHLTSPTTGSASVAVATCAAPVATFPGPFGAEPSGSECVGGTPQPHAAIAVAVGPAGIPAVSTWGMAVMGLLVLTAATIVIRRAMYRGQAAALN